MLLAQPDNSITPIKSTLQIFFPIIQTPLIFHTGSSITCRRSMLNPASILYCDGNAMSLRCRHLRLDDDRRIIQAAQPHTSANKANSNTNNDNRAHINHP
ncbi:hypothetical protein VI06_19910 [Aquitalea magnusonii]|nr:hypothetical protein VI06_19910 [Aquitalea magnusonii]